MKKLTDEEKRKVVERIFSDLKKEELEKRDLLQDEEFFKWLLKETKDKSVTCHSDVKDDDNIEKIALLFQIIANYAKENYLLPEYDGNCTSYFILLCNECLRVSEYNLGTSQIYSCSNVSDKFELLEDKIINCNDIMYNKIRHDSLVIDKKIGSLKENISDLLEYGISVEYLRYLFDEVIVNKDEKVKRYTK